MKERQKNKKKNPNDSARENADYNSKWAWSRSPCSPLFDLADLLPTEVFLFILSAGNGDRWHRNHCQACCCPSQQIKTHYWHWWNILLQTEWPHAGDITTSVWRHRLNPRECLERVWLLDLCLICTMNEKLFTERKSCAHRRRLWI